MKLKLIFQESKSKFRKTSVLFVIFYFIATSAVFGQDNIGDAKKDFENKADQLNCVLANFLIQTSEATAEIEPFICSGCCYDCGNSSLEKKLKKAGGDNKTIARNMNSFKLKLLNSLRDENANELFTKFKDSIIVVAKAKRQSKFNDIEKTIQAIKFETRLNETKQDHADVLSNKGEEAKTLERDQKIIQDLTKKNSDLNNMIDGIKKSKGDSSSRVDKYLFWSSIFLNLLLVAGLLVLFRLAKRKIEGLEDEVYRAKRDVEKLKREKQGAPVFEKNNDINNQESFTKEIQVEIKKLREELLSPYPEKLKSEISEINSDELKGLSKEYNKNKNKILIFVKDRFSKELNEKLERYYYDVNTIVAKYNKEESISQKQVGDFPNLTKAKIDEVINEKISLFLSDLSKGKYIEKVEFQKKQELLIAAISAELKKLHDDIKYINRFSQQPSIDGYFVNDKLSEIQLPHHLYKIEISVNQSDNARFSILSDNERAIKTAIQSYSNYLTPVCDLENNNTSGVRAEMAGKDGFGKLKLEGEKWRCTEKLKIKIS